MNDVDFDRVLESSWLEKKQSDLAIGEFLVLICHDSTRVVFAMR
jgi:hypothetical protein